MGYLDLFSSKQKNLTHFNVLFMVYHKLCMHIPLFFLLELLLLYLLRMSSYRKNEWVIWGFVVCT
jgi:hypothetical protein